MMPSDFQHIEEAEELMAEVRALRRKVKHKPELTSDDELLFIILNGIPFFNSVLRRINSTTSAISKLVKKTGNAPVAVLDAGKTSPFIGIALNILDFLQIPLIYLASFALGRKPPITLSNNARWLYAAILLTLCLIAFTIPTIAPFIAIGSAAIGLGVGAFTLGKLLREYYQDKRDFKAITEKINSSSYTKLQVLHSKLETACEKDSQNYKLINTLIDEISALKKVCVESIETIKAMNQEAHLLEQKLNIESDLVDSCVGIILSSLAISGTVVTLFFPPIGLFILCAATLAGTAYVISRFMASYFTELKTNSMEKNHTEDIKPDLEPEATSKPEDLSTAIVLSKSPTFSKTAQAEAINPPRKPVTKAKRPTRKVKRSSLDQVTIRQETTSLKSRSQRMRKIAFEMENQVKTDETQSDTDDRNAQHPKRQ